MIYDNGVQINLVALSYNMTADEINEIIQTRDEYNEE